MLAFKRTFKLYGAEIRVHEIRYGSKFGEFGPQWFLTFFFLTDAPPKYETLFGNQVSMLLKFSAPLVLHSNVLEQGQSVANGTSCC
jgi:hypothetical protein